MAETLRNFAGNVIVLHNKSRWIKEPSKPMDSRAEQRGEPNQPNQGEAMSEQAWWKKELYGNVCGTDEAKVILSDIKMYERLEDLCERLEAVAEARGREEMKNIFLKSLRQYGNTNATLLALQEILKPLSPTQGSSNQ